MRGASPGQDKMMFLKRGLLRARFSRSFISILSLTWPFTAALAELSRDLFSLAAGEKLHVFNSQTML